MEYQIRKMCLAFGVIVLLQGCADEPEVSACCSCLCEISENQHCNGALQHALKGQTCSEVCDSFCVDKTCRLLEAKTLNEGECPGGFIPFL